MNATYITQQQFDDLEGCASYLTNAQGKVDLFRATFWFPLLRPKTPAALISNILKGEKQMTEWYNRHYEDVYPLLHQILADALYFLAYLIPQLKTSSTVDTNGLSSTLAAIAAPPEPPLAFTPPPLTNCLQAYKYHAATIAHAEGFAAFSGGGFSATRNSFGEVLPRVIDFMSVHLQIAERLPLPLVHLEAARNLLTDAHSHYTFGMNGMANLLAQHSRIHILTDQIKQHFRLLLNLGTFARFRADVEVIQLEANQAQLFCSEILALRRP